MIYRLTRGRGLDEKGTGKREKQIVKRMGVCLSPFLFEELTGLNYNELKEGCERLCETEHK